MRYGDFEEVERSIHVDLMGEGGLPFGPRRKQRGQVIDRVKIVRRGQILQHAGIQNIPDDGRGTFFLQSFVERIEVHGHNVGIIDIGEVLNESVADFAVGPGDQNGFSGHRDCGPLMILGNADGGTGHNVPRTI